MTIAKISDSIKITFREENAQEIRMAAFLRSQKEIGKELKTEVMKAVYSFLDTFAVGADPNSTSSDVETAFITSMISMSSQMSTLALYCRVKHGINLSPESWRTFGLLPSPIARTSHNFLPTCDDTPDLPGVRDLTKESVAHQPQETVGQRLLRENQERSEEIDREIAARSIEIEQSLENTVSVEEKKPQVVTSNLSDYDQDEDDDDETDAEYLARMALIVENRSSKVVE